MTATRVLMDDDQAEATRLLESIFELEGVKALVKRARAFSPPQRIDAAGVVIDRAGRIVRVGGQTIPLTAKEFDLLAFLASHAGRVFSRSELLTRVWSSSSAWQSSATVTEHVRRVRQKIEAASGGPSPVTTVRGAGYRFDLVPMALDLTDSGPVVVTTASAPARARAMQPVSATTDHTP